jgi:hypothetical protein
MQHAFVRALMQHDFVLARIRLTRMAAERGPILSGACGQVDVSAHFTTCNGENGDRGERHLFILFLTHRPSADTRKFCS